jgi:hypothetical protein
MEIIILYRLEWRTSRPQSTSIPRYCWFQRSALLTTLASLPELTLLTCLQRTSVFGTGPGTPQGFSLTMSWTGDNNDVFTETLTTVASIDRSTLDQVIVHFSGTVSDSLHLFMDTPAFFVLNATQFDGGGTATTVTFTNSAGAVTRSTVPEPSTWVMMALGFGALGYTGFRRRNANIAALFP